MTQQIGLEYSNNIPLSAIISNRLVDIQLYYSGLDLAASIQRSKRKKYLKQIDRHVINLVETYGYDKVSEVYNMIFKLDNSRKKVG